MGFEFLDGFRVEEREQSLEVMLSCGLLKGLEKPLERMR
jgi:hypothetical protein